MKSELPPKAATAVRVADDAIHVCAGGSDIHRGVVDVSEQPPKNLLDISERFDRPPTQSSRRHADRLRCRVPLASVVINVSSRSEQIGRLAFWELTEDAGEAVDFAL